MNQLAVNQAFQLVAGHPALDLVNTVDYRFRKGGAEELLKTYDDLLQFCEQSELLALKQTRQLRRSANGDTGARVLEQSREFREALCLIFYARLDGRTPPAVSVRTLERYFKGAFLQRELCWNRLRLHWELRVGEGKAELPLWALALSASGLMLSGAADQVRACDSPECRWLFVDTSKNHTRRWCDMKLCGNRMKARRFKAQRPGGRSLAT